MATLSSMLDRAGVDEVGFEREVGIPITQLTGAEVHRYANLDKGWSGTGGIRSRLYAESGQSDSRGYNKNIPREAEAVTQEIIGKIGEEVAE